MNIQKDFLYTLGRKAFRAGAVALVVLTSLAAPAAFADDFRDIVAAHSQLDYNQDGVREIEALSLLFDDDTAVTTPSSARLIVVLVEERLLQTIPGSPYSASDLTDRLDRWRSDLRAQGFLPKMVRTRVYDGPTHQDGRTVLALRELFKETKRSYPSFQGAVLVGSFPEAMLLRSILWRKNDDRLMTRPDPVARRSDLVLADLDGNWPLTYQQPTTSLDTFNATQLTASPMNPEEWPCVDCVLESRDFFPDTVTYEDFFYVRDDDYSLSVGGSPGAPVTTITIDAVERGLELSAADRSQINPIARPEIIVSRINARHVAVIPDPSFADSSGLSWLDSNGKPQAVQSFQPPTWVRDPALERQLLVEYFDRNHDYRAGNGNRPFRPATASFPEEHFPISSLTSFAQEAADDFGSPETYEEPDLDVFAHFLRKQAVLKGIHTHAARTQTLVGDDYPVSSLEGQVGTELWNWVQSGLWRVPSLADLGENADHRLYYSMWRNGALADTGGVFFFHNGCDVASPEWAEDVSFDHPGYGERQNAESFLFFLNGVAMLARSKDFNDRPVGFTEALGDDPAAPWGDGWLAQFEVAAQDAGLAGVDVQRKRSYNWVLLGDWTLTLHPPRVDDAVVAFDGTSYRLRSMRLEPGTHTAGSFEFGASLVDSFAVPEPLELRMYHSDNGLGRYATVRGDLADVDDLGYDNYINSVAVRPRETIGATLYSEGNYWGTQAFLPPGHYTFSQIRDSFGIYPKSVSSLKVQGVEVFLYDRQTWWNNWIGFDTSQPNLGSRGWNDRMESIVVFPKGKTAVAYQHQWSGGHVILEPGRYDQADLADLGLNGWGISSLYVPSGVRLRGYRQPGFQGGSLVLDGVSRGNLHEIGWNDDIRSIVVELR